MLSGGAGADTLSYAGSGAGVYVNLASGYVSGGDARNDTIANFEHVVGSSHGDSLGGDDGANRLSGCSGNDWLYGHQGDDHLTGGGGADRLNGRLREDMLIGGTGADRLTGGAGDDLFRFASGGGADTVTGFTGRRGSDRPQAFNIVDEFTRLDLGQCGRTW